jgi:hypothetical protein
MRAVRRTAELILCPRCRSVIGEADAEGVIASIRLRWGQAVSCGHCGQRVKLENVPELRLVGPPRPPGTGPGSGTTR